MALPCFLLLPVYSAAAAPELSALSDPGRLGRPNVSLLGAAAASTATVSVAAELEQNLSTSGLALLDEGWRKQLPVLWLLLYMVGFGLGWGPVPILLMSELLPARYRNQGSAIVISANWTGGFLVTLLFGPLTAALGGGGVFCVFGVACLLAAGFVWRCVPETRGKTLEDIELMFLSRQLR